MKTLAVSNIVDQTFFNSVHSDFVGDKGKEAKSGKKGVFGTLPGDYLVLMNRGVADSLYDQEVKDIVDKFDRLPVDVSQLDAIANVIVQKAFKKIIEFDYKRPLVDKIRKMDVHQSTLSVDECHCVVLQVVEIKSKQ